MFTDKELSLILRRSSMVPAYKDTWTGRVMYSESRCDQSTNAEIRALQDKLAGQIKRRKA